MRFLTMTMLYLLTWATALAYPINMRSPLHGSQEAL
jgi:hypothetical protein